MFISIVKGYLNDDDNNNNNNNSNNQLSLISESIDSNKIDAFSFLKQISTNTQYCKSEECKTLISNIKTYLNDDDDDDAL